MATTAVFLVLTYLFAAVPVGLVLTTILAGDDDIRTSGSGNIGATNVARVHGWRIALVVLLADMLKGFLPVLYGGWMRPDLGIPWWTAIAAAAFVGHCFPIYLRFHGGKGVATGGGAMLAIAPVPTALAAAAWAVTLALTGRSSVASIAAVAGLAGAMVWLADPTWPTAVLLAAGVLGTHTPNLRRLATGQEKAVVSPVRWGRKPEPSPDEARELLEAPPGGGPVAPPMWKEPARPSDP